MAQFLQLHAGTSVRIASIHTIEQNHPGSITLKVEQSAYNLEMPNTGVTIENGGGIVEYATNYPRFTVTIEDAIEGYRSILKNTF